MLFYLYFTLCKIIYAIYVVFFNLDLYLNKVDIYLYILLILGANAAPKIVFKTNDDLRKSKTI